MSEQTKDEKIHETKRSIETLEHAIKAKIKEMDTFEPDWGESEKAFDEYYSDLKQVTIFGQEFDQVRALRILDHEAYKQAVLNFADARDMDEWDEYKELQEELEDLESQLEDLQDEIEALRKTLGE